jgi:hypothetical protein
MGGAKDGEGNIAAASAATVQQVGIALGAATAGLVANASALLSGIFVREGDAQQTNPQILGQNRAAKHDFGGLPCPTVVPHFTACWNRWIVG